MTSSGDRRPELGVLFVHGMGEQQRGDSLTEAGDALISWLERWCERAPHGSTLTEGDIAVLESSLRTADNDALAAPHLTLRLTLPSLAGDPLAERQETFHWVLAESWWSETFRPATFNQLAWEALRRPADDDHRVPAGVVRLITYGQAMRKLRLAYRVLKQELDGGIGIVGAGALVAQLALGLVLAAAVSMVLDGGNAVEYATTWFSGWSGLDQRVLLASLIGLIVFGNTLLLDRSRREIDDDATDLGKEVAAAVGNRDDFRWLDLWSSADPAPNGPLGTSESGAVSSWRVRNAGSVILDHSIYWQNLTEFVGAVAKELGRHGAGTAHFPAEEDPFPDQRLRLAALTRAARIQVLSALRVMWLGAVLAFGLTLYPTLKAGLDFTWLPEDIPLISLLRDWLPGLAAFAMIAVLGLLGWVLITKVWGAGIRADDRSSFAGRVEGPFPWPAWGGVALLAIVPAGAFAGLWLAARGPLLPVSYALSVTLVALALFTFVSRGGQGFAEDPPGERVHLAAPLWVTAVAFIGVLIAITAGWFRPQPDLFTTPLTLVAACAVFIVPLAVATVSRWWTFLGKHAGLRAEVRRQRPYPFVLPAPADGAAPDVPASVDDGDGGSTG